MTRFRKAGCVMQYESELEALKLANSFAGRLLRRTLQLLFVVVTDWQRTIFGEYNISG